MLRGLSWRVLCALGVLLTPIAADGAVKTWTAGVSGDFGDPAKWSGGVPGAGDSATFNAPGTYTVTFDNSPNPLASPVLNEGLSLANGTVTFTSGGSGSYTYHLSGNGSNNAEVAGGSLTLGAGSNPLHFTVDDILNVQDGAMLQIGSGSQVNAANLRAAAFGSGTGTVIVDGPGSTLNVTNATLIGQSVQPGSLTYRNSAVGSLGDLFLGDSDSASSSATLNVESDADLITGNVHISTAESGTATGIINIHGGGSTLMQSGSSELTIGGSLGVGRLNVGTIAGGGTLSTGTGTTTINANGIVTIGDGANAGTLNANGNVIIDGGMLLRQNSGSAFNLAAGRTMTIQNGGLASFEGSSGYATAANATYTVAGFGSMLHADSELEINDGGRIDVGDFGSLTSDASLNVATVGNGTLNVDGAGTSAASLSPSSWGLNGNVASVTFSNGAAGTFQGLFLADDATPGTTSVVDVLSGADLDVTGALRLASLGGPTGSATLSVEGDGSSVTQSSTDVIIVGHASEGTATLNIGTMSPGGEFTGTGELTILATGAVNVDGGGTLNANGGITIDGGQLDVGQGSTFALAAGKTMTIRDGGRASFSRDYITSDSMYDVSGANARLETLDGGELRLSNAAQLNVSSEGAVASANGLAIGDSSGDGALTVDGANSAVTATGGNDNYWATGGNTATVVFRNNANGDFSNYLLLAHDTASGTTANVTVESGAQLIAGGLQMAALGGATTSAMLTVDGIGSTVALNPGNTLYIGSPTDGTAVLNVQNGATFSAGAGDATILEATGVINIDGGFVDLQNLDVRGGTINFLAGSLSYLGDLSVTGDGLLGGFLSLDNQHYLTLDGTTTVEHFHTLTLDGGSLSTGTLVVSGNLVFNSGTISITGASGLTIGAGGTFGGAFTLGAGRTVNVTNTATIETGALLVLESGGSFNVGILANDGTVVLDGVAAVLGGTAVSNNGLMRGEGIVAASVTNTATGEIRAVGGKTLTLMAPNGTNAGTISLQGGTLDFVDSLTNGPTGQIVGRGVLRVGLSGLENQGHVALSSGISDVFGEVHNNSVSAARGISISGNAEVTFWDDVDNAAGSLFHVSSGSSATFFGNFSGAGITGAGDMYFEADISPGASPAAVEFGGDVFFGSAARLKIELAGTTLGSEFDHLEVQGKATLDGVLDISTVGGFAPGLGDSFEVLHATGGVFGQFAATLPTLSAGLGWSVVYANFSVLLEVVASALPGDFNQDGSVDAADYVVWRKGLGTTYTSGDYDDWRAHFGQSASGESGSPGASASASPVPEPAAVVLVLMAACTAIPLCRCGNVK